MANTIHSGIYLKKKQIQPKSRAVVPRPALACWKCRLSGPMPDLLNQNLRFAKVPSKFAQCCYGKSPGTLIKNTELLVAVGCRLDLCVFTKFLPLVTLRAAKI